MTKPELGSLLIELEAVLKKLTIYWQSHEPAEIEKETEVLVCDSCEDE